MSIQQMMLATAAGIGGNDSFTKLLLHCDGADASTTFTDSSASAHTVTAAGDAQVDTAQSKFGGASALFDGTGDYLSVPDHANFEPAGDFTFDCWIRLGATSGAVMVKRASGTFAPFILYLSTGTMILYSSAGGAWDINGVTVGSSFTTATWYHIALVRSGTTWKFFKDGTETYSATHAHTLMTNTSALEFGRDAGGVAAAYNGHMDEIRWSDGVARWTAGFTPNSAAYS